MAAYVIANIEVTDPDAYAEYRRGVQATIDAFGGRFLVRAGRSEALEGTLVPARIVVLEFPDYDRAKAWWDSDLYRPLREMRMRASHGDLIVAEGV